jgi:hypothetical protein
LSFAAVPVYALVHVAQSARGVAPSYHAHGTLEHPAQRLVPNLPYGRALYACSLTTSGLAGVAVGLLLFELLRRRTTTRVAFLSTTLVVLGTPVFSYATSFYSHVPAAALLVAAVLCLDQRGVRPLGLVPSTTRLRLAGASLALVPGCEYLDTLPALLIGLGFLVSLPARERPAALGQLALGAALPVLGLAAYHTAAFGVPWRTGYSFMKDPEFAAGHAGGLLGIHFPTLAGSYGLSFGVRRGLLHVSPIAVLGLIFGAAHVRRRKDLAFSLGLGALGLLFLLNAGYYMWWGGAAAGPRHLVPALPFLAAGVMVGLRARWRWVRRLTLALGALSVLNMLIVTAVGIEGPERGDILLDYAWPRLRAGRLAAYAGGSNLGAKLGLTGAATLLPLLIWGVVGFAYLWAELSPSRPRSSPAPS